MQQVTLSSGCVKCSGTDAGLGLVFLQTLKLRIAYNAQGRERELPTREPHDDGCDL